MSLFFFSTTDRAPKPSGAVLGETLDEMYATMYATMEHFSHPPIYSAMRGVHLPGNDRSRKQVLQTVLGAVGSLHDRRTRPTVQQKTTTVEVTSYRMQLTSRMVFFTNSAKSGWICSRPLILKRTPLKIMFSANMGVASGAKYEASFWATAYLRTVSPSRVEGSTIFAGRDISLCLDVFVDLGS